MEESVFNKVDDEFLKELLPRVLLEAKQDIAFSMMKLTEGQDTVGE